MVCRPMRHLPLKLVIDIDRERNQDRLLWSVVLGRSVKTGQGDRVEKPGNRTVGRTSWSARGVPAPLACSVRRPGADREVRPTSRLRTAHRFFMKFCGPQALSKTDDKNRTSGALVKNRHEL